MDLKRNRKVHFGIAFYILMFTVYLRENFFHYEYT